MAEWIDFVEIGWKPKTKIWAVDTKPKYGQSLRLGVIKWYATWRKYSFFPESDMVFEKVCLRDIALFLEEKTKEHKEFR